MIKMKYLIDQFMLIKEKTGALEIMVACPVKIEMMKDMMMEIIRGNKEFGSLKTENTEYAYNYINKEKEIAVLYHFKRLATGLSERFALKASQELLNYIKESLNHIQNQKNL